MGDMEWDGTGWNGRLYSGKLYPQHIFFIPLKNPNTSMSTHPLYGLYDSSNTNSSAIDIWYVLCFSWFFVYYSLPDTDKHNHQSILQHSCRIEACILCCTWNHQILVESQESFLFLSEIVNIIVSKFYMGR